MSKRRKSSSNILFLLFCFLASAAKSQTQYLSKDEFIKIVRSYHPVVRLSNISLDKAAANIFTARGAFDPTISSSMRSKELKGDMYYSYFNSEVTVPTWYGLDIKAGVDNSAGTRIDPETTSGQVSYVGLKFSINSVVYDKRRAALQQAKLMRDMTESQQRLAINELIFEGLSSYWIWVKECEQLKVIQILLGKTYERLQMVKGEAKQGARPDIDTVEAFAQYCTLSQQQKNSEQACRNAALELSAYLWRDNGEPYLLPEFVEPMDKALFAKYESVPELQQAADLLDTHPKLKIMERKLDILDLERKLKIQSLIPKLSFNAAALSYNGFNTGMFEHSLASNYKFSVDLNIPLLMREARGELQTTNFKIQEQKIEKSYIHTQLNVKLRSYYNEYISLQGQVSDYERVQASYNTLLAGEVLKFHAGESTLFLVNSRELKYMEAAQKLIELKAKLQKAYTGILFSAGLLG